MKYFPRFIAETIIFCIKYGATTFLREIFFPGSTHPSWNITEIPGVGRVCQAPPGMEIPGWRGV